ncbi:hypothetical protein B5X24_HaOG206047 [Helicoverpa armigera]|uniref:Integrase catalytic domain-containing protein n=1 Tax=Helicoverpa armigera TaxID=29058 RepID=A0A2W1BS88_HELAM|nr:hypothetical protein B5X24_HaOG206047 [Helicoverpa armigera]
MGALPRPRVTQSYPFSHTGCDFAGPIQVRSMKGRGHKSYKGYIAVFICLATKAIHLELVGDLSTELFIAALRRFMARRGHVHHMYSDNATNFVGAAKFLYKEILEITQSPQFQNTLTNIGTQWHFIPPAAPHFGGIWEAGVKSMKHHLRRVIGDSTLTYEELSTFLHQIEACLNSRPLCIQTENINDNIVLTPSHFLIGREAVGVPHPIDNINTDLINRWKHIQKMKKDFWNSWTKEYLHQLQQRYKWKSNEENLKVGAIVLIKDENISPSRWPLAKIKEIHPGHDGATRVVTLERSQGADQKRSIHTLIPLPVNEDTDTAGSRQTTAPAQTNLARLNTHKKTHSQRAMQKSTGKLQYWFMTLLLILQLLTSATTTYTIKNLESGLYIEQMGNATLDRGTFRIETTYERRTLNDNLAMAEKVLKEFKTLCDYTSKTTINTHCDQYYHHLQEEEEKLKRTHEYLTEITNTRKKRAARIRAMVASRRATAAPASSSHDELPAAPPRPRAHTYARPAPRRQQPTLYEMKTLKTYSSETRQDVHARM